MKQFALITMMLLSSSLCIQAQQKLLTTGKTWIYHNKNTLNTWDDHYYKIYAAGDTIVNGIKATSFYVEHLNDGYKEECGIAYEDNGVIYEFDDYINGFYPLLNFNLHSGETFYLDDLLPYYDGEPGDSEKKYPLIVADEKTYCIEGTDRRVLTIKNCNYDWGYEYWIEGVGALNPDIYNHHMLPTDGSVRYLSECYDGDKLIYSKANFDKLVTGIDDVASDMRQCEEVYDLMGRRVTNPVKGCLYVTASGKKVW